MKYFVVSDIHGFYIELISALKKKGFDKRNKNHTLIVCGDVFDRGKEALKVYKFLMSIPKKRRILIRGNHEELFLDLLKKSYPEQHDFSNHTVDTFCQIAGVEDSDDGISFAKYLESGLYVHYGTYSDTVRIDPTCKEEWKRLAHDVANSDIVKWLNSDEWKDFYELGDFIFVHSFIPLHNLDGLPNHYTHNRRFEYFKDWRTNATPYEWSGATWGCPFQKFKDGYFKEEGKTLVCGHWSTSDFFEAFHVHTIDNSGIFYGDGIIGIDGGVWQIRGVPGLIHKQNVLVIEDGKIIENENAN